ncbi:GIY-YIG nuclease family protein [Arthrobacter sp. SIMBA_036]|uniref:GIY-YIG nuclease family protein n=1 Tax=Arthrobacter sp. SIMBA_036 TaxID=3085778 RepID=UPI00397CA2C8
MRAKIAEDELALANVERRAANIRAGYVYVISNIGAFGENMVKIGMTRRLEPMDGSTNSAMRPCRSDLMCTLSSTRTTP